MIIRVATFLVVAVALNSVHAHFGQASVYGQAKYPQERYVKERFTPGQYEQERFTPGQNEGDWIAQMQHSKQSYLPVNFNANAEYPHERYREELYTPAKYAQERRSTANYAQERLSSEKYAQERRSTAKYAQERYGAARVSAHEEYPQERYSQERHPGHATSQYTQEWYPEERLGGPAGECHDLVGRLEDAVEECSRQNQYNFAGCVNEMLGPAVVDVSGGLNTQVLFGILDNLDPSANQIIGQYDLQNIIPAVEACIWGHGNLVTGSAKLLGCLKNVCDEKLDYL